MAHKVIYGQTLSGKSTLAKAMVKAAIKKGIVPVIYDPTLANWDSEFITDDFNVFVSYLKMVYEKGHKIFAIIDEADTCLSMAHRQNWWIFTRGRHFGIEACAITQRPQLIAPSIRGNAPEMFVFHLGKNDSNFLAEDISAPRLVECPNLVQGSFYSVGWKDRKRICQANKIF